MCLLKRNTHHAYVACQRVGFAPSSQRETGGSFRPVSHRFLGHPQALGLPSGERTTPITRLVHTSASISPRCRTRVLAIASRSVPLQEVSGAADEKDLICAGVAGLVYDLTQVTIPTDNVDRGNCGDDD